MKRLVTFSELALFSEMVHDNRWRSPKGISNPPRSGLKGSGPLDNPKDAAIVGDRVQDLNGLRELSVYFFKISEALNKLHERGMNSPVASRMTKDLGHGNDAVFFRKNIGSALDDFAHCAEWLNRMLNKREDVMSLHHQITEAHSALKRVEYKCNLFLQQFDADAGVQGHADRDAVRASPYYRTARGILNYFEQSGILRTIEALMAEHGIEQSKYGF